MADEQTLALYDARAAEYGTKVARETPHKALRDFMAELPEGAHVLDLGCGPGHASRVMAEAGFTVDPVDGAAGMVALVRETYGLPARQALFEEITGEAIYDGVWANFSLTHASREAMPAHLGRLARALRPEGLLHLALKTGEGTVRDSLGRFYTLFTPDEIRGLLDAAGFDVTAFREGVERGFAGTDDAYAIVRARCLHG